MKKNILKVLFSNGIITIVGLVNSFIFPIILTITGYACYHEFLLFVSYINICHLGIPSGMFLNYAGHKYEETNKEQYKSEVRLLFLALLSFSLMGVLLSLISGRIIILYVSLMIMPHCIIAGFKALYQAWERFNSFSLVNTLPSTLITAISILIYCNYGFLDGTTLIQVCLGINWIVMAGIVLEYVLFTRGHKSKCIFSRYNISTLFNGLMITLGNYIFVIFHSLDKLFVDYLYEKSIFAYYSFAMAMENLMSIFITSFAVPFYTRLAGNKVNKSDYEKIKQGLLMFGGFSGCAFFAVAFVISHWIPKYNSSIEIISIFFAVFPAMAVINGFYISLYKLSKQLKRYITTLCLVVVVAFIFNVLAVMLNGGYKGIAVATMLTYYFWLFYSQKHFEEIRITLRDIVYLSGFMILFFATKFIQNYLCGFAIFGFLIVAWDLVIYRELSFYILKMCVNDLKKCIINK